MGTIKLLAAAFCLAATLAACGSQSTNTGPKDTGTATATGTAEATSAQQTGGATITIADMSFGEPITVSPGAQITVKNDDSAEHSVTSQTAGQFDVEVDGKKQATLTAPSTPGEYPFYCTYHSSMKGTLIVK